MKLGGLLDFLFSLSVLILSASMDVCEFKMLILLTLLACPTLGAQTGSSSSVPVFPQEPEPVYYLIRGGAVTITCRAAPAVQINIKCGGQWVSPSKLVNSQGIDSLTSVHFLETSVELEEEDVTDEYTCDCYAWNSVVNPPLSARSKPGRILTAKMPKRFEQEPIGSNVEVGTTVRLQCLPPEGIPPPKVFWLRNGEVVDVEKEINFIISHEGSLIINQARLTDSANYTCGAQNMAGRRLSESAALNVYMNGGWSSWSQWSECGGDCVKSVQRRNRQCNNPSPVNGGAPCSGEYVQKLACTGQCKVDGAWSTWSSWSPCSVDCQQRRRRQCNNPAPSNNGLYCNGTELDSIECTGDRCIVISDTKRGDVALYAGLAVAVVVFILVVILVVRVVIPLLRRRKSRSEGFDSKSALKLNHGMLGPDLTKTMPVISPGLSSSGSSSCSTKNESPNSYSSCADAKAALRESKQRLIPCHTADTSLPLVQQYQTKSLPTNEKRSLIMTSQLPPNIDPEALVWSVVGSEGARLTLPDSGISLLIPEGAIDDGMTSEVYLAVSRDDKDRPKLNDSQTVISAVILCGPSSLRLRKSAILSFPHCASVNHGQWSVSAYSSDPTSEAPTWNHVCTLGEETLNTSVYVQMDHNQCHLMTESLSRYALIGQPCAGHTAAVKVLRLAVFAPQVPSPMDFNLRVYCVEDIKDALEIEKRLGGFLLDKPKQMLFQYCGANLCLTIEEQGAGWRCKMAANYQEIPFRHIWSGTQNGLHCSFALEQQQSHERHLTCDIHVFQAGLLSNRQILRISHDLNEHHGVSSGALSHNSVCNLTSTHRSPNNSLVTSGYSPPEHPAKTFRLYGEVKREFCQILDPPNTRGNDWRLLARHLGVDRYINYFATKMSPTEHILDLWEARHNEASALSDLIHTLKVMGRTDAASFLEEQQNHRYQTIDGLKGF